MKIVALIQARMGSSRLPGKVLKTVAGQPMLKILINRLKKSKHIDKIRSNGRNHALIVVAEAVLKEDGSKATIKFIDGEVRLGGIGSYLGEQIYKFTNAETRVTVLGHVQRGAQPTYRDRLIASAFGVYAVDLIAKKQFNRII